MRGWLTALALVVGLHTAMPIMSGSNRDRAYRLVRCPPATVCGALRRLMKDTSWPCREVLNPLTAEQRAALVPEPKEQKCVTQGSVICAQLGSVVRSWTKLPQ